MKKRFPGVDLYKLVEQKVANEFDISARTFVDEKGIIHSTDNLHTVYVSPYKKPKFDFKTFLFANLNVNILLLFC